MLGHFRLFRQVLDHGKICTLNSEPEQHENAVEQGFKGFGPDSFSFFRDLARANNKAWFEQNRGRYEEHVTGVFRSLLRALEPRLLVLNPNFETGGKTNGNFSRINRDIRFSRDKSPYKLNYYLYVFDRRRSRDADGRLYVGLSADCVTVGFSIYASWKKGAKSTLETLFRRRCSTHRKLLDRLLHRVVRAKGYQTYWHRQEKGKWVIHPGRPRRDEDWLSLEAWVVRKIFLPNARVLHSPRFINEVEKIFSQLYPFYVFTSAASPDWPGDLSEKG